MWQTRKVVSNENDPFLHQKEEAFSSDLIISYLGLSIKVSLSTTGGKNK